MGVCVVSLEDAGSSVLIYAFELIFVQPELDALDGTVDVSGADVVIRLRAFSGRFGS